MSAVITWRGRVLGSVQESPPSSETKVGGVALADPPGLGVRAEAAMSFGLEAYSARNGSASCQVSPESETGIRSTTRTPAGLAGGCGTSRSAPLQATNRATATAIDRARISRQDNGSPRRRSYGANGMASVGTFSWGGAYGSGYSVDPVEHLVIVFMINQLPNRTDIGGRVSPPVYQARVTSRAPPHPPEARNPSPGSPPARCNPPPPCSRHPTR